jgi:4-amino-4-deoxy-L-arabinose transferase-like glycosyltransferase
MSLPNHALSALEPLARGWRAYVVLTLLLLATALPGFLALPPLDRDESRFAQATTQMMETGDFVRISFQDQPRNKKPVGIHWMQAASVALTVGPEARAIQAYRIPSIIGALLAVFAIFWIGARLADRPTGLLAGGLLAVSLLLSTEAAIAKTDAMLTGLIAVSMAALFAIRQGSGRKASFVFWAAFGLSILVKGPVGPMVVGLAIAALAIIERKIGWLKPLASPLPVLLGLVVVLPWMIAIGIETNGAFFRDAIMGDLAPKLAGGHERHASPPGYHLLLLPLIFWPGSLFLGAGAMMAWQKRADPNVLFLLCWLIPGWLAFEAAPTKLFHYTGPVHAALALLCALGVSAGLGKSRIAKALAISAFLLGGLIVAAVLVAVPHDLNGDVVFGAIAASIVLICVLAAAILFARDKRQQAIVAGLIGGLVFCLLGKGFIVPQSADLDLSRRVNAALIAANLHPRLSPGKPGPLVGSGYAEPSLIFLTRTDSGMTTPAEAARATAGAGAVVEASRRAEFDAMLAKKRLIGTPVTSIEGLNYSNGDRVKLDILRISAAN